MKNIRFVIKFLILVILFSSVVGTFVYVVDPLQQYRKASYSPLFSGQQRYQNPGLAKNYTYDMIIIGSSMTENFVPSKVGESLDGNVLKLSIEGSTAKEQRMIADVAINTGQVKKVLWGLDYFSLRENSVRDEESFPFYLYDGNKWNDFKYIFNISNVKHAFGTLLLPKDQYTRFRNLDLLNNWDSSAQYGPDQVFAKWKEARFAEQTTSENEPSLDVVKQRFEDHIISLIKAHPEIEFTFYYPPYSIVRQQVWYSLNPARFSNQQAMKKYMFEQFSNFNNVKVFDFQSDSSITYDLSLYKDLSHHSAGVNQSIIEAIAADTHRVTKENVDLNNSLLEQQVQSLVINENGPVFSLSITMDGQPVAMKQITTTSKDQVRVPLKDFAMAAGIEFSYDIPSKTATLTRENVQAIITVGESEALVNGQPTTLEAPIQIVQNRLVAPLIAVTRLLDGKVEITNDQHHSYFKNYDLSFK
ncbi:Copper amine oxidase N-terminal domain-containing protein [Fontibacillus panacisegetis]|uniref:Copper amine oxidase N-terminal domain-containing protein n=1 Tax=Fontibacillus panacisegetis TaxID=670482 RepID=A0A1G7M7J6_9BACL|nr:copper amine oxidase N-terminal domain-containing protein [Fontibacillus panacisegetis]SDF57707.1 Copper amine oxidase N-terminal domain-containing protein [Fontibacillus panacisegetis]